MRFPAFSIAFLASNFAKADFLLPESAGHVSVGLPNRISWSTDSVTGPISLFLVPAGAEDASASIFAIGTQIPNYGMYQWVPRDTLTTAESYFSILMVDSKNFKTVSDIFLIVGLQNSQPGSELRRRVSAHVKKSSYGNDDFNSDDPANSDSNNSGTKSSKSGKNEGTEKFNSTETLTTKLESKETSKSLVLETSLSACSAVVTKTEYLCVSAANGSNIKTKSSDGSKSTSNLPSLAVYLDKPPKDVSGSSKPTSLGFKGTSASNNTSSSKSTFQDSSLKHSYGFNSSSSSSSSEADFKKTHYSQSSSHSSSGEDSGSKYSASNSNSKDNSSSAYSYSGHESKGTKDSSGHKFGPKESNEDGHGHGNGSSSNSTSGHKSNSTLEHASTRTYCALVTSTTIIYMPFSRNTHTQETKTYTPNIHKTTLIQTSTIISTALESLFSISISAPLASISTLAASTTSIAAISTTATSTAQTTQVSKVSEISQLSSLAISESVKSIQSTPLFSASIIISSSTEPTTPPSMPTPPETINIASTTSTESTTPENPSSTDSITPPPSPPFPSQTATGTKFESETQTTALPPVTLTTLSSSTTSSSVYNLTILGGGMGTGTPLSVFTGGGSSYCGGLKGGIVMGVLMGVVGWIL
ncbi:hypothetical protein ACHAPF_008258 [Botrytis cinerea]